MAPLLSLLIILFKTEIFLLFLILFLMLVESLSLTSNGVKISSINSWVYLSEGKNYKPAKPGDKDRPSKDAWEKAQGSEYQGRKVKLNKPFRTSGGPKKFSVYVKNEKGNVVKVNFGDPNMKIKKNIPARRKSFRARHNCENPGPKWKARYWACKSW